MGLESHISQLLLIPIVLDRKDTGYQTMIQGILYFDVPTVSNDKDKLYITGFIKQGFVTFFKAEQCFQLLMGSKALLSFYSMFG